MTTAAAGRFAPSVLNPANVDYVESWDNDRDEGNPPTFAHLDALVAQFAPEARRRGPNTCTVCGQRLRYVVIMALTTTEELFVVGEDCAESIGVAASIGGRITDLRAKAAERRENVKRANRRERNLDAAPGLRAAFEVGVDAGDEFVCDVYRRTADRDLSEKQIEAVLRAAVRITERAARDAAETDLPVVPVVEGRVEIVGEILTVKFVDGYGYGQTDVKMLVRDDRGFKVWGTRPTSLGLSSNWDEANNRWVDVDQAWRGDRVCFTATVTASKDDESFGFFKRPVKAAVIARAETTKEEA